ncbi:MAG: Ig-like domain-containing protein [Gemmatimonadaceae bacterium]
MMNRGTVRRSARHRSAGWFAVSALLGALIFACANPNQPPGGPPDIDAPRVVKITPNDGTIGAKPKAVVFQFDEVISETPKGSMNLGALIFISPRSGVTEVDWRRSQLDVKPKDGWKPNTVYSVLLGPGVMDLRNNAIDTATRIVFSTGGPIPETKIEGVVFDWQGGRFAPKAIVEAIAPVPRYDSTKKVKVDSTIYQTIADSLGRYSLRHLPPNTYTLRAIVDRNNNRLLEPLEPWDTVAVALLTNAASDLYAFSHDTLGLKISTVSPLDSNKIIKVAFNKPISPSQVPQVSNFLLLKVVKNDTTTIAINTVFSAPQKALFDSLQQKARNDSIAKSAKPDTSLAARTRRDSVAKAKVRDSLNLLERQRIEERRLLALRGGRPLPPKDTTPQPKMKRPALYTDVFITPVQPLEFDAQYVIVARNMRSVSGYVKPDKPLPFKSLPKPKPPEEKKNPNGKDTTATTSVPVKR